jgi:hypothetical protein
VLHRGVPAGQRQVCHGTTFAACASQLAQLFRDLPQRGGAGAASPELWPPLG